MRALPPLLLLCACTGSRDALGPFVVETRADGAIDVSHAVFGPLIGGLRPVAGTGAAAVEMRFGSFRFDEVQRDLRVADGARAARHRVGPLVIELEDRRGEPLATAYLGVAPLEHGDALVIDLVPADAAANRLGLVAELVPGEPILGLGGHAFDVDHAGEAFPLWVSEPGVGKSDEDALPEDWFLTGTRHASAYPVPLLHRPDARHALLLDTGGRVELDLGAAAPDQLEAVAWTDGALRAVVLADADPVGVLRQLASWSGRPALPPPWAFGPWNDAIRGPERVLAVAQTLRAVGAPSSVIWTEDWRGATDTGQGYRLGGEWRVDRALYPDAEGLDAALEAQGFQWLAYFAPFVRVGTDTWDEAVAADALVLDAAGAPLRFPGVTFEDEGLVDLSASPGRAFVEERLRAALAVGFDGWMTDYGEWLPTDAVLADGTPADQAHNRYPAAWQAAHVDAIAGADAVFFARSGWQGAQGLAPIVWGGDQRTSFDADDGLPTVLALGLGLAASGVPVFTHDVAGYNSIGNPPSDRELWLRWASLGAFSPVLRTHHGAFDQENHQFDSDAETLAHWTWAAQEHTRLFPYRYGLAARAADEGVPMLLPVGHRYAAARDRVDAWLLGDALLVAPVLTRGASARQVDLPADVSWYDWWTDEPVASGVFDAPVDAIPVFAASGTTVPLLVDLPDTLVDTPGDDPVGLDDVDGLREVRLYGGGGPFTEADGTTYLPRGAPTGPGEASATLRAGTIEVAGVSLAIEGPVERTYTVRVIAPAR